MLVRFLVKVGLWYTFHRFFPRFGRSSIRPYDTCFCQRWYGKPPSNTAMLLLLFTVVQVCHIVNNGDTNNNGGTTDAATGDGSNK
mmetsp:Transcript_25629/g.29580  ORF Transcript_25629/g.29580 Transcript_25629/m.29580 type:complete len:85 (-) Transcript_25629:11-265(-)